VNAFSPAERLARLRLVRTDGIGPVSFAQLIGRFGSGLAAAEALAAMGKPLADPSVAATETQRAITLGARHLFHGEADYPPLLAELADPPSVLVTTGDPALAHRQVVSIVGARNASAAGRGLARAMAQELGQAGWVVASGMARGIDSAAHGGAIETGTIACVAGGVDIAYPPENAALQADVAASGLILSELPPGTEPQARHFPRRNRLIAGVGRGVIVIEAAPGSGSLITARLAGEAGRDIMAVPGHPMDPRSRGGNGLIKDGAVLVETAADVLAVLAPFALAPHSARHIQRAARPGPGRIARPAIASATASPAPARHFAPEGRTGVIIELLSVSGVPVDEVIRASGLPVADVQAILSDLELDGKVTRLPGGKVALAAQVA